jgi:hypothetical protein
MPLQIQSFMDRGQVKKRLGVGWNNVTGTPSSNRERPERSRGGGSHSVDEAICANIYRMISVTYIEMDSAEHKRSFRDSLSFITSFPVSARTLPNLELRKDRPPHFRVV